MKKQVLTAALLTLTVLINAAHVAAYTVPSFPSCVNPQGSLKVSYSNGIHGIVVQGEKTGADAVYSINADMVMQCFCPTDSGNGIQTNWLKASGLSSEDRRVLTNNGWTYISNGADWGLDSAEYYAKNIAYVCGMKGGLSTGEILSLASTGNTALLQLLAIVGIVSLASGVVLERTARKTE